MDAVLSEQSSDAAWSLPVNEKKKGAGGVPWAKWRGLLFFIEVYLALAMLLYITSSTQLVQQYVFQRIARETLSNTLNYTAPIKPICLKQDYIVNHTRSNASIVDIQKRTNTICMYYEVIGLGASSVMALFYGSLSDIVGRKPILGITLLGLSLSSALQAAIVQYNLDVNILLIASGIGGMFGGLATVLGVSFAAISDVTSKKWRTLRLGTTESAIGFGKASSYLLVYYWIDNNGCDFRGPAYSMLGVALIAFIYLILIPESLPPKGKRDDRGFKKLVDGVKVFFIPSRTGFSKWWRILVCVVILCIECLCVIGAVEIMNYFLHNKPLEWSYNLIGIYGFVTSIALIISLVVVLPLLLALPIPAQYSNPSIMMFGAVIAIVTNIMMATVKSTWEMFVAGILQCLQMVAFPAVRGVLSGLVKAEDYGAVLTVTASLQMLASAGSTVLFNKAYHPEAEVNGHHYNAGIVFWITAGLWAAVVPLVMTLFKSNNEKKTKINLLRSSDTPKNYEAIIN